MSERHTRGTVFTESSLEIKLAHRRLFRLKQKIMCNSARGKFEKRKLKGYKKKAMSPT